MKRTKKDRLIIVLLFILILSILLNFYLITYNFFNGFKKVQGNAFLNDKNISDVLSLDGFKEVSVNVSGQYIVLLDNCTAIAATTTEQQADSIDRALTNRLEIRPTTHDLVKNILEYFGIEILRVKIIDMHDGNYFSDFILKQGNKILNLDVKPSDGIAVALRMGIPIYIKEDLLDKYGQKVC